MPNSIRLKQFAVAFAIFAVSLLLRVWAIHLPLNTDEAKWLWRGASFMHHLLAADWGETYETPHPGVSSMWVIGMGMMLNRVLAHWNLVDFGVDLSQSLIFPDTLFPIQLYVWPRLLQAVLTSMGMVALYRLIRRIAGNPAKGMQPKISIGLALISIALLTVEPFFLAYQRFITTDALQADFGILGLLSAIYYFWRRPSSDQHDQPTAQPSWRWLIASGMLMGLAIASKLISLFALPGLLIWIVWQRLGGDRSHPRQAQLQPQRKRGSRLLNDLLLWSGVILATIIVIWPALWTQPGYTLNRVIAGLMDEEVRSFFFFWGKLTDSPGPLFYPVVLAFRLSPLTQMGILACGLIYLMPSWRHRLQRAVPGSEAFGPLCSALGLTSLSFLGCLSLASTKIDRYIIFVIPALAIISSVGWIGIGVGIQSLIRSSFLRGRGRRLRIWNWVAIALATGQLLLLLPHAPYYLTYYNPLLGGMQQAQSVLMVGQGEGLDQIAHWLNQQPEAEVTTVTSWYRSVMAAYFKGQVQPISSNILPDERLWQQSHRVVFYKNQLQRQLPSPEFLRYFTRQPVLHRVEVQGSEYAIAFPGPIPLPSDLEQIQHPVSVPFGRRVELVGYDVDKTGGTSILTLYWTLLKKLPEDVGVYVEVRDRADQPIYQATMPMFDGLYPTKDLSPGLTVRDVHELPDTVHLEDGAQLVVGWQRLPSTSSESSSGQQAQPRFGTPVSIGSLSLK